MGSSILLTINNKQKWVKRSSVEARSSLFQLPYEKNLTKTSWWDGDCDSFGSPSGGRTWIPLKQMSKQADDHHSHVHSEVICLFIHAGRCQVCKPRRTYPAPLINVKLNADRHSWNNGLSSQTQQRFGSSAHKRTPRALFYCRKTSRSRAVIFSSVAPCEKHCQGSCMMEFSEKTKVIICDMLFTPDASFCSDFPLTFLQVALLILTCSVTVTITTWSKRLEEQM